MDGSIRGMDDALAEVFAKLDELGLSERALVAVVSDHGTELLEHDAHFHGHSVYGELNRVPMILWGPSYLPAGRRVETTVQTIDLMPTLLELSGLPASEAAQGRSLTSLFEESGEARVESSRHHGNAAQLARRLGHAVRHLRRMEARGASTTERSRDSSSTSTATIRST